MAAHVDRCPFGFGQRRYPELDSTFVSPVDHAVLQIPWGPELNHIWAELDLVLWAEFQKLSPSKWPSDTCKPQPASRCEKRREAFRMKHRPVCIAERRRIFHDAPRTFHAVALVFATFLTI